MHHHVILPLHGNVRLQQQAPTSGMYCIQGTGLKGMVAGAEENGDKEIRKISVILALELIVLTH